MENSATSSEESEFRRQNSEFRIQESGVIRRLADRIFYFCPERARMDSTHIAQQVVGNLLKDLLKLS